MFDTTILDPQNLLLLGTRLLIDGFFVFILIRCIYYPNSKDREYVFSPIILNISVFLISSLLSSVQLDTGFAFGLFAVFSILRYRTHQIPIREMTCLFIMIIIAIINSTVTENVGVLEVVLADVVIVGVSFILERFYRHKDTLSIVYDKIEFIHQDRKEELYKDLYSKFGREVVEVKIGKTDFLKDIVF